MPRTPEEVEAIREERRTQRTRLIQRLRDEDADDLADRLAKCGRVITLNCTCCGHTRTAESRCDLKWCPACQHKLSTRTALRYAGITANAKWPLFVTFTVENYDEHTFDFVRHVRRSFGKLRRLRWWKRCVVGGIASIETTNKGRGWHPHVHALIDCKWLAVTTPQPSPRATKDQWKKAMKASASEVGEQWKLCCGRNASVKVRRVWGADQRSAKPITMEVLKYSVKGSDLLECDEEIAPLIRMMDGCRLVTSWGTMYGHPALKRPRTPGIECDRCHAIGEWLPDEVIDRLCKRPRNYTR